MKTKGFTLLEILLVIAAIGILAAIVIIAINPTRQLAQVRDTERRSELRAVYQAIQQYAIENAELPTAIQSIPDNTNEELCAQNATDCTDLIDLRSDLVPIYLAEIPSDPLYFTPDETGYLIGYHNGSLYVVQETREDDETEFIAFGDLPTNFGSGAGSGNGGCDPNYILVAGNSTFGTSDFCVMKYEAKNSGGVATSQTSGLPWTNIFYAEAVNACTAVGGNLISNNQWMTIATDLEQQDQNWSSGTVGIGSLFRGHSENNPSSLLAADSNDANGLFGISGSATYSPWLVPSEYRYRTMTLSSGDVIWDFAGNAREYVSPLVDGADKPVGSIGSWVNWNTVSDFGSFTSVQLRPSNSSWTTDQGVGAYEQGGSSLPGTNYALARGGFFSDFERTGIFHMNGDLAEINQAPNVGFRCVTDPS